MADFIPKSDAEFDTWLIESASVLEDSPTSYGLTEGQATALATACTAWHEAYSQCQIKEEEYHAARMHKDEQRDAVAVMMRSYNSTVRVHTVKEFLEQELTLAF